MRWELLKELRRIHRKESGSNTKQAQNRRSVVTRLGCRSICTGSGRRNRRIRTVERCLGPSVFVALGLFEGQNDKLESFNRTVGRIRLSPLCVKLQALLRNSARVLGREVAQLSISVYVHYSEHLAFGLAIRMKTTQGRNRESVRQYD